MSLHNVSDEIVRQQSPLHDVQPILTLASDFMSDIQKIMAGLDDPMDSVLHKEINLVKDLLANSALTEVPLTPYLMKALKKKAAKETYITRSQGSPPSPPKCRLFIGMFGESTTMNHVLLSVNCVVYIVLFWFSWPNQ